MVDPISYCATTLFVFDRHIFNNLVSGRACQRRAHSAPNAAGGAEWLGLPPFAGAPATPHRRPRHPLFALAAGRRHAAYRTEVARASRTAGKNMYVLSFPTVVRLCVQNLDNEENVESLDAFTDPGCLRVLTRKITFALFGLVRRGKYNKREPPLPNNKPRQSKTNKTYETIKTNKTVIPSTRHVLQS